VPYVFDPVPFTDASEDEQAGANLTHGRSVDADRRATYTLNDETHWSPGVGRRA